IFARLILLEQTQQNAARRRDLLRYRLVVARNKFRRSGFTAQRWSALPSPVIGLEAAVSELLPLAVNAPETDSHGCSPSHLSKSPPVSLGLPLITLIRPAFTSTSTAVGLRPSARAALISRRTSRSLNATRAFGDEAVMGCPPDRPQRSHRLWPSLPATCKWRASVPLAQG